VATPEQIRRRGRWSLILGTIVATLTLGAVLAYADVVTPDGDVVAAGINNNVTLAPTTVGTTLTPQTSVILECNGNNHVDDAQRVNVNFAAIGPGGSQIPTGVGATLSATNASIGATGGADPGVPASWPEDGTNCNAAGSPAPLNDNGNSTVTIGAPTSALGGPFVYTVRWNTAFSVAGNNDSSSISGNVQVSYNVTVNPRPPSGLNAVANGTSEIDLTWTASPDASLITDYKITRTKTVGGATATLTAAKNATSFNDLGLAASSEYCYTIRARYNDGTTDFFSTPVGPACATTASAVVDADNDGVPDASDNCPSNANPGQENNDGDAFGDACDPDDDNDSVADGADNCQFTANTGQENNDGDAFGDACDPDDDNDTVADGADNCPLTANADQTDTDNDGQGDACDGDDDGDGVADGPDNCDLTPNPAQTDTDGDGIGDACDADNDNDGVPDASDNCPSNANPGQENNDADVFGDACDPDDDNDTVADGADNCPLTANADQTDTDGDGQGDACDADDDDDGVADGSDNCPLTHNVDQTDTDGDGQGDACDADDDGDGVLDGDDNCPLHSNPDQADADNDGLGNPCDSNAFAPTADLDALDVSGNEGDTLNRSGSFDDQDGDATLTITQVSGAGSITVGSNGDWSWSLATTDDASGTVEVTAYDGEHAPVTDSFDWEAVNVPPTASAGGPYTCGEGVSCAFDGFGSDVPADALTFEWDLDYDGVTFNADATGEDPTPTFPDGPNTFTVALRVSDDDGGSTIDTSSVTVENSPPTIAISGASSVNEGSSYSLTLGTITDPGTDTVKEWIVHWGDGQSDTFSTGGVKTHTYADGPSDHDITVDLKDEDGTFLDAANDKSVHVDNIKPTPSIGSLAGSGVACIGGNTVTLGFSWTDPAGSNDTYSYDVDWGDGSAHATGSNAMSPVTGLTHTYAAGSYTIKVTVNDEDAGPGNQVSSSAFSLLYATSGILQPINLTGTRSSFKIGSTIPVKVRVTDCHGTPVTGLPLKVKLQKLDNNASPVNETTETSVPDVGDNMRYDGSGTQYIYNLSTKRSQLVGGGDLTPGTYRVTVYNAPIAATWAEFDAK
jgi:hypothetical protein